MRTKIKKELISLFMVMIMALTMVNTTKVQAETTTSNDWISQYLSDYEPLQNLIKEYPDTKLVQSNTSYILTDITKDENGNILKTDQKKFSSLSDMQKHEKYLKSHNSVTTNLVGDGATTYHNYTQIKIGLSLYKYSSQRFFVACTYDWVSGFNYDIFYNYKAVVGLAVGSGLSMEGTSYGGRVTMSSMSGTVERLTADLLIKPTGTSGIAYSINESAQKIGMLLDMQGVISCTVYKTDTSINYNPAYGEYADVTTSLNLNSFFIALPTGIGFNSITTWTPYPHQDTLDVR